MVRFARLAWVSLGLAVGLAACGESPASAQKGGGPKLGDKLSQFDRVGHCSMVIAADGTIHALFTESPTNTKPKYLYHRSSSDAGKSWSAVKNLSDDESSEEASFGQLAVDGKGRVYAIWKYVKQGELLDGPGGSANGRLVYRVLEGAEWSKRVPLGDEKVASFSFFGAVAPDGVVHVVWSQMSKDAAAVHWASSWFGNLTRQAALDGATVGAVKDLIVPKPVFSEAEMNKRRQAGEAVGYDDTRPKRHGLINLRGYIDAQGVAHFVAEQPGNEDGPSNEQTGKRIVHWDGQKLGILYTYDRFKTYNNFNNPPTLVLDAAGKEHLIREPEEDKVERPVVRDYLIEDGQLGDPVEAVAPQSPKGAITNWQVHTLPGGKIAVTATLSQRGGYRPDDLELYITFSSGEGKWEPAACLTSNEAAQTGFAKETVGGSSVGTVSTHSPRHAAVALDKSAKPVVLLVNSEDTLVGFTNVGVTGSGRAVSVSSGGRVDAPALYFLRP